MRISDWSSDVCSSDLVARRRYREGAQRAGLLAGRPVEATAQRGKPRGRAAGGRRRTGGGPREGSDPLRSRGVSAVLPSGGGRTEEHTSELPSLMRTSTAVFCLHKQKHKNNSCV